MSDEFVKKPKRKVLYMSHTMLSDFLTCQRYYYYKYIRRLQRDRFKPAFVEGRVIHECISQVLMRKKKAIDNSLAYYRHEMSEIRKHHPEMTTDQEVKLSELEFLVPSIIKAYSSRYAKFIAEHEHVENELPFEYQLESDVIIVGKVDNLLRNKKKAFCLHELKSAKYISVDYVRAIQTDPQTTLYHLVLSDGHRALKATSGKVKIDGIVYDVLMKPSIRQKKDETRQQFMARLVEWYNDAASANKFHMEKIKTPLISRENLLNTYSATAKAIRAKREVSDYVQNFGQCVRDWGFCEMYDLCHRGETKENLAPFSIRQKYSVQGGK